MQSIPLLVTLERTARDMAKSKSIEPPRKAYYKAIADFYIAGFREVKEGEFITISPDDIRDLGLADKVLQENKGG